MSVKPASGTLEFADGSPLTLLASLRSLREQGLFCDAAVVPSSGGVPHEPKLLAHQVVLAAASESLCAFLSGDEDSKPTQAGACLRQIPQPIELKMQGIQSVTALRATVEKIYGGDCGTRDDSDTATLSKGLRLKGSAERTAAAAHLAEGLQALRARGLLCDIVLVVGGERFVAHQAILAASSAGVRRYLREAIGELLVCAAAAEQEDGAKDAASKAAEEDGEASVAAAASAANAAGRDGPSQPVELELEAISQPEALRTMLDHIYGADRDAEYRPSSEAVNRDVLRLAIGFGLPSMKERATQWLVTGVNQQNLEERLAACDEFEFKALRESVLQAAEAAPMQEDRSDDQPVSEPSAEAEAEEAEKETAGSEATPEETQVSAPDVEEAKRAMQTVRFARGDPVPQETKDGFAWPTEREDMKILGRLMETFEERPAWLLGPLKAQLPASVDEDTLLRLLPYVAYQWHDGPWQQCLCLLGWDPRDDRENAPGLQVVCFRDPYLRGMDKESQAQEEEDWFFRRPPTKPVKLYQLEDIKDNFVKELVESSEAEAECTRKTGWLSQITLDGIKERLSFKSHQMREKLARQAAEKKSSVASKKGFAQAPSAKRARRIGGC